jgi:hypothetical protein
MWRSSVCRNYTHNITPGDELFVPAGLKKTIQYAKQRQGTVTFWGTVTFYIIWIDKTKGNCPQKGKVAIN